MKKPILGMAMVLATACADMRPAEQRGPRPRGATRKMWPRFENTSAAQIKPGRQFRQRAVQSFAGDSCRCCEPAPLPAAPAAKPKFVLGDRDDYRWQLGLGVEFLRFRSNVFDASIVGVNTTISYYTNSWFALEGNLITAFGPPPTGQTT